MGQAARGRPRRRAGLQPARRPRHDLRGRRSARHRRRGRWTCSSASTTTTSPTTTVSARWLIPRPTCPSCTVARRRTAPTSGARGSATVPPPRSPSGIHGSGAIRARRPRNQPSRAAQRQGAGRRRSSASSRSAAVAAVPGAVGEVARDGARRRGRRPPARMRAKPEVARARPRVEHALGVRPERAEHPVAACRAGSAPARRDVAAEPRRRAARAAGRCGGRARRPRAGSRPSATSRR